MFKEAKFFRVFAISMKMSKKISRSSGALNLSGQHFFRVCPQDFSFFAFKISEKRKVVCCTHVFENDAAAKEYNISTMFTTNTQSISSDSEYFGGPNLDWGVKLV